MINPSIYNDTALMNDWFNYRTHNAISPELYQTMSDFNKDMVGIEDGVKEMVRSNWCRIMDENLKVAIAKEKGRIAGEKFGDVVSEGVKVVGKWIKRAIITGLLVAIGVVMFDHWYAGYKELKNNGVVYQLEEKKTW